MPEDISAEELIFTIRKVGLHLTTQLELCFKEKEISGIQAYFLVYILRHHPKGTFLTELYHEIGVSKPTLSVLIKKLKQKGYLSLEENPEDIRKKKVVPTAKLLEEQGVPVKLGVFGADMKIRQFNDGPVTILYEC